MKNRENFSIFKAMAANLVKEKYNIEIKDLFSDRNKDQKQEIVIDLIETFSGFRYDFKGNTFSATLDNDATFVTVVIEPEEIESLNQLHEAVVHLIEAQAIRNQKIKNKRDVVLPEYLYEPVERIQEISRENVMSFVQEEHGIDSEQSLFEQEQSIQTEVLYNLFRTFTGCIPYEQSSGAIIYSLPQDEHLKLSYGDFPNLSHNNLYSHLRDMRGVKKNNKEMTEQVTKDRIEQIKGMVNTKDQDRQQDPES